jgi:hypothetical protein
MDPPYKTIIALRFSLRMITLINISNKETTKQNKCMGLILLPLQTFHL